MHSIKQLYFKKDLKSMISMFTLWNKKQRSKLKPTKSEEWKLWWLLSSSSFLFLSCQNQNEWFYGMSALKDSTQLRWEIWLMQVEGKFASAFGLQVDDLTFTLLLPGWLPLMNESTVFRARVRLNGCTFKLPLIDGEFLLSSTLSVCS